MAVLDEALLEQFKPLVRGSRILVLGDERAEVTALSTVLASAQFSGVVEAAGHHDPVIAVQSVRPDLVVLDLAADPSAGDLLLERIRSITTGEGVLPLLVASGADPLRRAQLLALGADDVLAKPLAATELLARVQSWLMIRVLSAHQQRAAGAGGEAATGARFVEAVADSLVDAVLAYGEDGQIRFANAEARRLGLDRHLPPQRPDTATPRLRGSDGRELALEEDPLWRASSGREVVGQEVTLDSPGDGVRTLVANARPARTSAGHREGVVLTLHDVTEQRRLLDELRRNQLHDPLTGLPNAVLFGELATRAMARTARDHKPLTVIMIVLDGVDELGDPEASSGPAPVNHALAALAGRLPRLLRPGDIAARIGNGFALLCDTPVLESSATRIVARLHAGLSRPLDVAGRRLTARLRFGVATTYDAHQPIHLLTQTALVTARPATGDTVRERAAGPGSSAIGPSAASFQTP
ncbi:MAG TPA: diguanylate cyclase [Kineosporiaceae bacterium]|nr:diguanylate cyclase [Kineosporiaceae bacterium]